MNADKRRLASSLVIGFALAFPVHAGDGDEVPNMGNSEAFRQGYKAGFDDGFARGYQRAQGERGGPAKGPPPPVAAPPPPPRSTGPISITRAVYGTGSRICDATRWTRSRANGRQTASLDISNNICGDPAPGDRKTLEVTYVCGSVPKTASAREHQTIWLDCTP
jgi:hypothetical protein